MTRRILPFLAVFIAFHPFTASASVTEAQAQALKTGLQEFLNYQRDVNNLAGSVTVEFEGEMTATPNGDMLGITLPRIWLKGAEEGDQNIDLGVISLNAVPDEKPGMWKMAMALPGVITVKEAGEPDFVISIGSHSAIGLFHERLGYFTKFDLNLMDIKANEGGKDMGFHLAKATLQSNLEESADGFLSGPVNLFLENMALTDENSAFKLGKISYDAEMTRLKTLTLKEYSDKILKHKDALQILASGDPSQSTPAQGQAIVDMMFDLYDFSIEGMKGRLSVENVDVETLPSQDDAQEGAPTPTDQKETFRLARASIGSSFEGMTGDTGTMSWDFGYSGATMLPMDPQYDGVMPTDVNIAFTTEKVPMKSLYELIKNTANSAVQSPEMAGMAGMGLLIKLPAMLAQAGSTMTIKDTGVQGGLYKASLEGTVLTDLAALTSFTGKFNGKFEGLDELLAKLRTNEKAEDSYNPEEYAEIASTLETIKSYGTAETGGTRSAYSYAMELTGEGKFLINGKEVDMSGGGAQPMGEPAPMPMPAEENPPQPITVP